MDRRPSFRNLAGTSRDYSLEVLYYCWHDGLFAHKALSRVRASGSAGEREMAQATEMAFGTIRMVLLIDAFIAAASGRDTDLIDDVPLYILRLASYQVLLMDRSASFAVVDAAVEQAKRLTNTGVAGFVNAVLRRISLPGFMPNLPDRSTDPVSWLSVSQSHPKWMLSDWIDRFGLETAEKMCLYDNSVPKPAIRANRMRTGREELIARLDSLGMKSRVGQVAEDAILLEGWAGAASNPLFDAGMYSIQDESSMLVARALAPKHGETVIDMCSAPGGKTCHAAELAMDSGIVIACDSNSARLELVKDNAARLGLRSVSTVAADAAELHKEFEGKADAVIADVPCSGLGVLARRPDARWRKLPAQKADFARIGRSILDSAALCLKPGGRLVFSTCTVSPEENEWQVAAFLERHADFSPASLLNLELMGISERGSGIAQLLQGVHGTDGFFISLLRKTL